MVIAEHVERCKSAVQRIGGRFVSAPVDVATVELVRKVVGSEAAGRATR